MAIRSTANGRVDKYVAAAIVCGPVPQPRDWRAEPDFTRLTLAERVMVFAEQELRIPEGPTAGASLRLAPFQEAFLYAVFDNPEGTREAVLSVARRNSKTFLISVLALAYIVGPLAELNLAMASAANARDQAALVYRAMSQMIMLSPLLSRLANVTHSSKRITGVVRQTEYYAMSADARTGHGRSLRVVILDEAGQILGPDNDYIAMLRSSQGSYADPLFCTISTQAASDADYLSVLIDDATRARDPRTVCHVYRTPETFELLDEEGWQYANPALGLFRSKDDLRRQLEQASRIPARQAQAENLLLNRRVALTQLWLAPRVWRDNDGPIDLEVFRSQRVALGLDLSAKVDLTAAVFAAEDDSGVVHLLPLCFTPVQGLEERAARDRAPYDAWVATGQLIAVPGGVVDYGWVAEYLARYVEEHGFNLQVVAFDRWRIEMFRQAATAHHLGDNATWEPVGQGYRDMSPRVEAFEGLLLSNRMRHGAHPLLNLAASNAIVVADPARNRKLEKAKSTQRIDPLVAAVMASYAVTQQTDMPFNVAAIIG